MWKETALDEIDEAKIKHLKAEIKAIKANRKIRIKKERVKRAEEKAMEMRNKVSVAQQEVAKAIMKLETETKATINTHDTARPADMNHIGR
jgi:hypothetical protein